MIKRILPCFLAILLLFTTFIRPVSAAEIVNEVTDDILAQFEEIGYSVKYAGDSYVVTDDDGLILEVKPNDASTYSLGGVGTVLIESLGGAMGVGTIVIPTPVLVILATILAAGIVVYSLPALRDLSMTIYWKLSDKGRAECAEIVASGSDNFTLSDTLASEFALAMGEVFYSDDGSFLTSGLTFSPTNMLEYDYSTQRVYGDTLTSSIYKYSLSSSPVAIDGTSLSLSIVDSPFGVESITSAFKLTNSVTGASLTFSDAYSDFFEHECSTYSFSAPFVRTFTTDVGYVYHQLGFWFLKTCTIEQSGENCPDCSVTYQSYDIQEPFSLSSTFYLQFANTGISALDNKVFDSQHYRDYCNFELRNQSVEGSDIVSIPVSVIETICSDLAYTMALTDTAATPTTGDKVFIPTAEALTDANKLTQTGALTGVWTDTLSPPITDSDTSGFWGTLWEWLANLPGLIADAIAAVLTPVLEYLFVPDLTALGDLVDVYSSKFGWVTDIYNFIVDFIERLTWNEPPKITIDLSAAESKYDWGGTTYALDMTWYKRYKDSVDTIISGIVWVYFLWQLFRRLPDILAGIGMIEENRTLERGWVFTGRSERQSAKLERAAEKAQRQARALARASKGR